MLNFKINNNIIDIEFNSIKIICCDNTTQIIKQILQSDSLSIDNKKIKDSSIIYINEFSKIKDFVNLTKSSNINNDINDLSNENNQLINQDFQINIVDQINKKYNFELLDWVEGDSNKLITNLFEIKNDYLNFNIFESLIRNYYESNNVFIIDNVSWLNINNFNLLKNYLNSNNFIIFTNDIRNFLFTIENLDLFCLLDEEGNFFDVIDREKFISFLEKELNTLIDNNFIKLINKEKNSLDSLNFIFKIKKLIK